MHFVIEDFYKILNQTNTDARKYCKTQTQTRLDSYVMLYYIIIYSDVGKAEFSASLLSL